MRCWFDIGVAHHVDEQTFFEWAIWVGCTTVVRRMASINVRHGNALETRLARSYTWRTLARIDDAWAILWYKELALPDSWGDYADGLAFRLESEGVRVVADTSGTGSF